MTIGVALFLIAVGAILRWAVTAHVAGIDIQTVGLILLVIGVIGLAFSLAWTFRRPRRPAAVVDDPYAGRRAVAEDPYAGGRAYVDDPAYRAREPL
jgi:membrane protein implicated in regulation of membrane protease activity